MNSSLLFDQFISNIQEIIDIEWMFELICMFVCFLSFYPHSKLSGKEEINSKTGESSKLLLYYSAIFWSRIEVLHVCHLVVGNTNEILHHIRN